MLPESKTEMRLLKHHLASSTDSNPLTIYVGSCPDYSHKEGLYDHKSLGENVPLLSLYHLDLASRLLPVLEEMGVSYSYVIMVADVEADDEVFRSKYCGGEEGEFERRCQQSVVKTRELVESMGVIPQVKDKILASSFYTEFGKGQFLACQKAYIETIRQRRSVDGSFNQRIVSDTAARMKMYRQVYGDYLTRTSYDKGFEFCESRTIRTMAQYLTLGKLMTEKSRLPVVIVHTTVNKNMFNARNKLLLLGEGEGRQQSLPILEMKRRVY